MYPVVFFVVNSQANISLMLSVKVKNHKIDAMQQQSRFDSGRGSEHTVTPWSSASFSVFDYSSVFNYSSVCVLRVLACVALLSLHYSQHKFLTASLTNPNQGGGKYSFFYG